MKKDIHEKLIKIGKTIEVQQVKLQKKKYDKINGGY
jgi:hypothetical protein